MGRERREEKGKRRAIGSVGNIDKPHEGPNRAALMASGLFATQLATPDKVKLQPRGPNLDLSAEEATERVKGFARHVGADLVGVTGSTLVGPIPTGGWLSPWLGRSGE